MLESQPSRERSGLDTLPLDVLINILEGLDYKSLITVRLVQHDGCRKPGHQLTDLLSDMYYPP
jgi:hypothetical protein